LKYRLYIDEVGDPGLKAVKDPRYRYLSLTGVIMELDYVNNIVFHELESLKKKYFHSHVDDPVILHRKELVNRRYPFRALRDENVRDAFDKDLLHFLNNLDYKVITVVIDKLEHKMRYQTWQQDPYHYSLTFLLQLRGDHWPQTRISKGSSFGNAQNVVPQKGYFSVDI